MKQNLPVTQHQKVLDASSRIVSTTDLKGAVTYANADFISISGFNEDELLGINHNLVRHPDMPPAAFQNLWDDIKLGKPWMGIVKNRCKNGDYYWVDAYVSPIMENSQISGYQSVRLKPEAKYINTAEALYATLWKSPPFWKKFYNLLNLALMGKIITATFASVILALLIIITLGGQLESSHIFALLSVGISGVFFAKLIASPWQKAAHNSKSIFFNPVAQHVYSARNDELGQLQTVIKMQQSQLETVVWRINDAASHLDNAARQATLATQQTESEMAQQKSEIGLVATAMNQMTATVQEVARNTTFTAESTAKADDEVKQGKQGKQVVDNTLTQINTLAQKVEEAVEVIKKLANDSEQIGGVVDVIRGIAEQTNLLALNAAIEAARAGEQGRGFAVVADEVRTLASRTQASTDEIQQMVQALQTAAEQSVVVMEQGQEIASVSVKQAANAGESLNNITQAVDNITEMSTQIATAAEQQSAVSDEINQNIVNIDNSSEHTLDVTRKATSTNQLLSDEISRLQAMVKQFGLK